MGSLLLLFPGEQRWLWKKVCEQEENLSEIRLRVDKPAAVICRGREWFVDGTGAFTQQSRNAYRVKEEDIKALLANICHYSLYAFEDELRQGFVTAAGGHRVGVAGQVVTEGESAVRTMKHISYVNIRVAHQMIGVADALMPHLYRDGRLLNTLIISPPGCGKTTLLRDVIRQVSDGNRSGEGVCVGVVDERSELAGSYLGHAQNDMGIRTDVLDACPKALGMMLLMRSMSPGAIAVDELGTEEDMKALHMASACGSRILATVHGENVGDYLRKFGRWDGEERKMFDRFVILNKKNGRPAIHRICGREEGYAAGIGSCDDHSGLHRDGIVV